MEDREKIKIDLIKPFYEIGQTIYVPEKGDVTKTEITSYESEIILKDKKLLAGIVGYKISSFASVRRGEGQEYVFALRNGEFYATEQEAKLKSKFLEVKADKETWLLAIGDDDVEDEESPYEIHNVDLASCCSNVCVSRDILNYCKSQGGLNIHERDNLIHYLKGCDSSFKTEKNNLGKILKQLEI